MPRKVAVVIADPDEGRFERTAPYLRVPEVQQLVSDRDGIHGMLTGPAHLREKLQDVPAMIKQMRAIEQNLQENSPPVYVDTEQDQALARVEELEGLITAGMPTQAEMRRRPAGAVDKHRAWESRNMMNILEWKNIRRCMLVSGMLDLPSDSTDVSNIEILRPRFSPQEGAMHGEQIVGKMFSLPSGPIEIKNVMSEKEKAAMAAKYPKEHSAPPKET